MVFRPPRLAPLLFGLGALLIALALAVMGIMVLLETSVSLTSFFLGLWVFLLLVLATLTGWRTYCCWGLYYHLTRDALTIHWGHQRVVVPMAEAPHLIESRGKSIKWARGIHWYAYHVACGDVDRLGSTRFYATHLSPAHLTYLQAAGRSYGLSLENPRRFARYLETCVAMGPLSRQKARIEEALLARLPLWRDRWALAMFMAAFLANLALFAYLSLRYPHIPSFLSLHFSPSGQVDRVGLKLEIFKLPGMALAVLGSNGLASLVLHLKERYLALLALATALLVQVLFWIAAVLIVT